jgi:hypothetical protein
MALKKQLDNGALVSIKRKLLHSSKLIQPKIINPTS